MDAAVDRRTILKGAALGAAATLPGAALAQADPALRRAVAAGHDAAIKRLRDWIALPTIAAEKRNIEEGCTHMMQLARDAGFGHVERVPTDGVPGVFATIDNGAKKTLALYFMYDVKQFDPAEWSSPPLAGHLVDRPGPGRRAVASVPRPPERARPRHHRSRRARASRRVVRP